MRTTLLTISLLLYAACIFAQPPFDVKITGKGSPIILLPGFNCSGEVWNTTVAHLRQKHTCYVLTPAGFAGTSPLEQSDSLIDFERDQLISFIEDRHLKYPVVIGFSFGGKLALWAAITEPDIMGPIIDIDGLPFEAAFNQPYLNRDSMVKKAKDDHDKIISKTSEDWQKQWQARNSKRGMLEGREILKPLITDSAQIEQVLEWDQATDLRSSFLMQNEMDTLDLRRALEKIQSPLLLLGSWQGWSDTTTMAGATVEYQAQIGRAPNATLAMSANGKHFLMWDDYAWMIGQIDGFLKRNRIK